MSEPLLPGRPSLLLVRHGTTSANDRGVLMGTGDAPLTEPAVIATRDLGGAFAAEATASRVPFVFSSDLGRAVSTARIIAEALQVPVVEVPPLRERDFGTYNGVSFESLNDDPDWGRVDVEYDRRPPGGESLLDVEARLFRALTILDVRVPRSQHILCVGHSTCWRLITEVLLCRRQETFAEPIPANLSIGAIDRRLIVRKGLGQFRQMEPGRAQSVAAGVPSWSE